MLSVQAVRQESDWERESSASLICPSSLGGRPETEEFAYIQYISLQRYYLNCFSRLCTTAVILDIVVLMYYSLHYLCIFCKIELK